MADLRAQFEMEAGAVRGMDESYKALAQVQSLREQLEERSKKVGNGPVADSIAALTKKLADLEGGAESSFFGVPKNGKQPENFSTLNQHFGNLLAVADSADARPTTQAQSVYREEQEALQKLQAQWSAIRTQDVAQLNLELQKAGQLPVNPDEKGTE